MKHLNEQVSYILKLKHNKELKDAALMEVYDAVSQAGRAPFTSRF